MDKRQYGGLLLGTILAGFIGGIGASWVLHSAPTWAQKTCELPAVIRAERFEVVDRDGKLRATLGTGSTGAPGPVLSDGLVLIDNNGQPRANLGLAADGAPGLMMYDPGLRYRIALDVAPDGAPALALASKEGRTRAELVLPSEGGPGLILYDARLQPRVTLDVSSAGLPALVLTGQNGTVLGRMPDAPSVNHKAQVENVTDTSPR
ncbi:MAG: hypothetical protein NZ578_10190 [Candidatus Binatia bacterium]|nr:hypothetical protein [Candidatus Binatia bacterium]